MVVPKITCLHCSRSQFLKHNMLHNTEEGPAVLCKYCQKESLVASNISR